MNNNLIKIQVQQNIQNNPQTRFIKELESSLAATSRSSRAFLAHLSPMIMAGAYLNVGKKYLSK